MKLHVNRDLVLPSLQTIANLVEKRQEAPILANVLLRLASQRLTLLASNTDVQFSTTLSHNIETQDEGAFTVNARKLLDICRALPENTDLNFQLEGDKLQLKALRNTYRLTTLPAGDFPTFKSSEAAITLELPAARLHEMISDISFAMANNDVRSYLNGLLFELRGDTLRLVASDGHRLALTETRIQPTEVPAEKFQAILPRRTSQELLRLLPTQAETVTLAFSSNQFRLENDHVQFHSRLLEARYADYERSFPKKNEAPSVVTLNRLALKQALQRAAIFSHHQHRGIRFLLQPHELTIQANNPEQEQAEETLAVEYTGTPLEIAFNVGYLLDALSIFDGECIDLHSHGANGIAMIHPSQPESTTRYFVMPMRL